MTADVGENADQVGRASPVLVEGRTCWRIAEARRAAVIVDAAAYFAAAKRAIMEARHTVFLIGWDFDLRIDLERDHPMPGVPDQLGKFLSHIVRDRPDLRIFVLRWDMSFLKVPLRAKLPLKVLDWLSGKRLDLSADHQHPLGACHHQKIVVIDDNIAFCGGIDMTVERWDTPAHGHEDPRRKDPDGSHYGPWHDVTTCLEGEVARALGMLARERWRRATGERVPPSPPCDPCWPSGLHEDFSDIEIGIARTQPLYGADQPEAREIERLLLAAIAAARRCIYIESQYFASHRIAGALIDRLQEADGPEVIVINPKSAVGWLEEEVMGSARAVLVREVRAADRYGRFGIYTPVNEAGDDIYVHAKVVVIDDWLLRVGSSNINNRSMGLDTECDLAVEADPERPDMADLRGRILGIRDRLLAEHLGTEVRRLRDGLASSGSVHGAIEAIARESGRRLVPFSPPELTEEETAMARSALLDPDRPEPLSRVFRRLFGIPRPGTLAAAGVAALAGLVALGRLGARARR